MRNRIHVEFFSTCPWCRAHEQLVSAICSAQEWVGCVELVVYRLDEDPSLSSHYPGRIAGAALSVDGVPVVPVGAYGLKRALEEAVSRGARGPL
ncbi:MAG TPA: hypothetical protein DCP20_04870 [Coriobacteriia bacterium]|nr:hypothetical protein [Coriobacteriia bacterium]